MSYRNPSPPPGHIPVSVEIKEKGDKIINGIPCVFYDLLMESGIFDSTYSDDEFVILTSEDEAEGQGEEHSLPLKNNANISECVQGEEHSLPLKDNADIPEYVQGEEHSLPLKDNAHITESGNGEEHSLPLKDNAAAQDCAPPPVVVKEEPKSPDSDDSEVEIILCDNLQKKVQIINLSSPEWREKECAVKGKQKKKRKKRERHDSSSSDESSYKHFSSSSDSKSDYEVKKVKMKKNIKTEKSIKTEMGYDDFDDTAIGSYYCKICKASMNCLSAYQSHINGKRHLKALKLKNTAEVVSKTIAPATVEGRYRPPPPGVYRIKTKEISRIQSHVDKIRTPCPGLEKVIEIQGDEITYYCKLCDAPCVPKDVIPHLQGQKHQLYCLKLFEPEMYEDFRHKKKYEIEKRLLINLREIERKFGRGLITVEKEFGGNASIHNLKKYPISSSRSYRPVFSRHLSPEVSFKKQYSQTTIPDFSKSDYYCKVCDSHMNCEQMWESHIRGKRHLKNLKKAPGDAPSKTKSVLVPNARAKLMDELDYINEPVVGLDEMRETQNPDAPGEMYNCFLCGACMTCVDVLDHILSLKHRKKYLQKIRHPDVHVVRNITIPESKLIRIVEKICEEVQLERGRGTLEVHVMRNAVTTPW